MGFRSHDQHQYNLSRPRSEPVRSRAVLALPAVSTVPFTPRHPGGMNRYVDAPSFVMELVVRP